MKKYVAYTSVLLLAGAAGLATSVLLSRPSGQPEISRPVPLETRAEAAAAGARNATSDVTLANLAGGTGSVGDWSGRPRLVNFWATWCAPCRREIPLLKSLQAAQQPPGLQVIGIAHDELPAVRDYAEDIGFNYPVLVGELEAVAAAEAWGVELMALPFTLVLSADDELVTAHIGEIDADEGAEIIDVLAKLESGALTLEAARAALGGD